MVYSLKHEPVSFTELAEKFSIPVSTLHRHLTHFEDEGLIKNDGNRGEPIQITDKFEKELRTFLDELSEIVKVGFKEFSIPLD